MSQNSQPDLMEHLINALLVSVFSGIILGLCFVVDLLIITPEKASCPVPDTAPATDILEDMRTRCDTVQTMDLFVNYVGKYVFSVPIAYYWLLFLYRMWKAPYKKGLDQ